VRTESAELVHLAAVVLVHSQRLAAGGIENAAVAGRQVLDVFDIRLQKALVLCVDLDVVADDAGQRFDDGSQTAGVVERGPWVLLAGDLVGDESACGYAVGEAVAAVAGDDVGVLLALDLADEGYVVDRLEDLSAPIVVNGGCLGEA
jgi:hypothetical protein